MGDRKVSAAGSCGAENGGKKKKSQLTLLSAEEWRLVNVTSLWKALLKHNPLPRNCVLFPYIPIAVLSSLSTCVPHLSKLSPSTSACFLKHALHLSSSPPTPPALPGTCNSAISIHI